MWLCQARTSHRFSRRSVGCRAVSDWGPADDMHGYGWALLVGPEDAWDGGVSEQYSISS